MVTEALSLCRDRWELWCTLAAACHPHAYKTQMAAWDFHPSHPLFNKMPEVVPGIRAVWYDVYQADSARAAERKASALLAQARAAPTDAGARALLTEATVDVLNEMDTMASAGHPTAPRLVALLRDGKWVGGREAMCDAFAAMLDAAIKARRRWYSDDEIDEGAQVLVEDPPEWFN